jgi:hypothetical protein
MSKVKDIAARAGLIAIAVGMLFGILPGNWIESSFHADPDGGSGILELLIALALIVVGAGIALYAARRRSRAKTIASRTSRRFSHLSQP